MTCIIDVYHDLYHEYHGFVSWRCFMPFIMIYYHDVYHDVYHDILHNETINLYNSMSL